VVGSVVARLRDCPGYLGLWTASTVSEFGTYVTTLAIQVLVVLNLHGGAADVGLVNASRWLPYLLFGLMSLLNDAAFQSFVPRLVPPNLLTPAHARLDQSSAVAETSGPAIAGTVVEPMSRQRSSPC